MQQQHKGGGAGGRVRSCSTGTRAEMGERVGLTRPRSLSRGDGGGGGGGSGRRRGAKGNVLLNISRKVLRSQYHSLRNFAVRSVCNSEI